MTWFSDALDASIPAFGESMPFVIVSTTPCTPPRISSASSIMSCVSRGSIWYFFPIATAFGVGVMLSRFMSCPSVVATADSAIMNMSRFCGVILCFRRDWIMTFAMLYLGVISGVFTGSRVICCMVVRGSFSLFLRRSIFRTSCIFHLWGIVVVALAVQWHSRVAVPS